MSAAPERRGSRPPLRRPPARAPVMSRRLALFLIAAALLVGMLAGYAARGDDPPAGLATETRELPVVTVTVPE
jgi:hypothetical protein